MNNNDRQKIEITSNVTKHLSGKGYNFKVSIMYLKDDGTWGHNNGVNSSIASPSKTPQIAHAKALEVEKELEAVRCGEWGCVRVYRGLRSWCFSEKDLLIVARDTDIQRA